MRSRYLAGVALLAFVPSVAWAQDATTSEQALQERIARQDEQIQALTKKVEELSKVLETRASSPQAAPGGGKVVFNTPGPRVESSKDGFSLTFTGVLQPQTAFYSQSNSGSGAPKLNNGADMRRAQFGFQGTAFHDFTYQFSYDAAASGNANSGVRDALISYTGFKPLTITVGNQKPQSGLEPSLSDSSNAPTFLEAGLPAALATPFGTRAIGVRVSTGSDHYAASLGIFGDDITNGGVANLSEEGWGVHGRVTVAPINSAGRLLHLGVSGYTREASTGRASTADPVTSQLRVRAMPEVTVNGTRLVDTGTLAHADDYRYLGLEAVGMIGPVSLQAEYARMWVDQFGSRLGLGFKGAYVSASWFITGESRVYQGKTGTFNRMRPKNSVTADGGWGAFELAARWSTLDLNSHSDQLAQGGVRGGELTDYTLGANWYINPYLRLMLNYIHADADKRSSTGVDQGTEADIVALRLHQEW